MITYGTRRAFLVLVTGPLLLSGAHQSGQCERGRCGEARPSSDPIVWDEDGLGLGLGLLQKAGLHWRYEGKLKRTRDNVSKPVEHAKALSSKDSRCPWNSDWGGRLPLTVPMRTQIQAFQELGFIAPSRDCRPGWGRSNATRGLAAPPPPGAAERENRTARLVVLAWGLLSGGLVLWSIVSVALVPRKRGWQPPQQGQGPLADEEAAWRRGPLHWLSLAWADGLLGCYGKCRHAAVGDADLLHGCAGGEQAPHAPFRAHWAEEVRERGLEGASLARALRRTVGARAGACLLLAVLVEVGMSMVGMVLALDLLLGRLERVDALRQELPEGGAVSLLEPTLMALLLLFGVPAVYRAASVVVTLLDGRYSNLCAAGLAALVYEKALSLPAGAGAEAGEDGRPNVAQLLNVDIIEAWGQLLKVLLYTLVSPLMTAALSAMLIHEFHAAGALGCMYLVPCAIFMLGFQLVTVRWWRQYQEHQDRRLKCLAEALTHIRTIKALAWENLAFERLNAIREQELQSNQTVTVLFGFVGAAAHTIPWFTMLIAMYYMLRIQGEIPAHRIIIVQRIMTSLLASVGMMMAGLQKLVVLPNALRRVKSFLSLPEHPRGVVREPALAAGGAAPAVRLRGSFAFAEGARPVLRDLDVELARGELLGVVGPVASGKSALAQAVVGELFPLRGARVEAPGPGRIAYCSQTPWIFEGTLRENVALGSLPEDRYFQALHATGLTRDLQSLPGGDQVALGAHGVRLSGGQRARVALARAACAADVEVLVLDEPFAALDACSAQEILEQLLLGPLLRGRARVVVAPPRPELLRRFDRLLLLEEGRVVRDGPPEEVLACPEFARLAAAVCGPEERGAGSPSGAAAAAANGPEEAARACRGRAAEQAAPLRDAEGQDQVTWATVRWWMQAAGCANLTFFLLMVVLQRVLFLAESLTVATWIDAKVLRSAEDRPFMSSCLATVLVACATMVMTVYAASRVSISASRALHSTVMRALLQAPIDRFFDRQPVGRLVNRLSFDMRQVDDAVAFTVLALLVFAVGTLVVQWYVLAVVPRVMALAAVLLYSAILWFAYLYRGTAIPLVFHSKIALSSMQDLQSFALTSSASIRANGMREEFLARYSHYSASVIRCQYLIYHVSKAWTQSRVFLCFSVLTCWFVIGGLWHGTPMGTLGTVLSLSFNQMTEFESSSMVFAQIVGAMSALQRLARYFSAPQEAAAERPGDPWLRVRCSVQRSELALLEPRRGAPARACLPAEEWEGEAEAEAEAGGGAPLVLCARGRPLLRAAADGFGLEFLPGCRLRDLAPACASLRGHGGSYRVARAGSAAWEPEALAQALCEPPCALWLDLWHSDCAGGLRLELSELTAGYGSGRDVLRGVSAEVPPRARAGLVGRSGCGKSTALLCLLRILEPRAGRVALGRLDAQALGLRALRSVVGIVPQDAAVFEGTWRHNIDPFGEVPDAALWEALRQVGLAAFVRALPAGLDGEVLQGGASMSFGQRQLLCLARMAVRQPPVLLLDECTPALDPGADEAAEGALLREFPMSTIVAVTHRAETLLGFDRIVVLDDGAVAEQGTVEELLKIEDGLFLGMVGDGGSRRTRASRRSRLRNGR